MPMDTSKEGKTTMNGWWIFGLLALWFVLQIWVLPRLGVKT